MNILTAIVTIVFLVFILVSFLKTRSLSSDMNKSEDARKISLWISRLLGFILLVALIATIQVSGIVRIPDPFQGQKITNELRDFDSDYGSTTADPPELKSLSVQPDLNAIKDKHKSLLEEFEGKR
jgi:hypothetical protein